MGIKPLDKAWKKVEKAVKQSFDRAKKYTAKAFREFNTAIFDISVGLALQVGGSFMSGLGDLVGGDIGKKFNALGDIALNSRSYIRANMRGSVYDIITGQISRGLTKAYNALSPVLLTLAMAANFASGNFATGTALLMQLDSSFGGGELLFNDTALLVANTADMIGFHNAKNEIENIRLGLSVVSGLVGAFGSVDILPNGTLSSVYNVFSNLYSGYKGYEDYQRAKEYKKELDAELERLEAEYEKYEQMWKALRQSELDSYLYFDIYSNFAGGKAYNNVLAGNNGFDSLNVAEPYRKTLSQAQFKKLSDMSEALNYNKKPFKNHYENYLYKELGVKPLELKLAS